MTRVALLLSLLKMQGLRFIGVQEADRPEGLSLQSLGLRTIERDAGEFGFKFEAELNGF